MKHEGDGNTSFNWNNPLRICKECRRLRNQRTDHPEYMIIKISQNTEKSPGDLRRLTVTPVKNHKLTLVRKNLNRVK